MTRNFYQELKPLRSFVEATNFDRHLTLPDDWIVVAADVAGSTQLGQNGQYKDVNALSVCVIVAIQNIEPTLELPFVFGGDGALIAVPSDFAPKVGAILWYCQNLARDSFKFELKVGMSSVRDAKVSMGKFDVAKWQRTDMWNQAAFSGSGWNQLEAWTKAGNGSAVVKSWADQAQGYEADFSGFECRWEPIPAAQGSAHCCLIVRCMIDAPNLHAECYQRVISQIEIICGNAEKRSPVQIAQLNFAVGADTGATESKIRARDFVARIKRRTKTIAAVLLGQVFTSFGIRMGNINWGRYKSEVKENADIQKFDGSLRMIFDVNEKSLHELVDFLDLEHASKNVCYGIHLSKHAILTCYVQSYQKNHFHFVDGSDGGYAKAAVMLKRQLSELSPTPPAI